MLSIVIPTQNEALLLPILLESIKKQSLQPEEIIVADDHSTDGTVKIAKEYGCKIVEGGLPSIGRNNGARVATGQYVLFLDADVELSNPDFLKNGLEEMKRRGLDCATCDVLPISDKKLDHAFHRIYNRYVRMTKPFIAHAPGFCIFAKRQMHEQIDGFDEDVVFCEDHDYAIRSRKLGKFDYLSSIKVPVSIRRFERDGRANIAMKYLLGEIHLWTLGSIKHNRFKYEFGHDKKKQKYGE